MHNTIIIPHWSLICWPLDAPMFSRSFKPYFINIPLSFEMIFKYAWHFNECFLTLLTTVMAGYSWWIFFNHFDFWHAGKISSQFHLTTNWIPVDTTGHLWTSWTSDISQYLIFFILYVVISHHPSPVPTWISLDYNNQATCYHSAAINNQQFQLSHSSLTILMSLW